MNSGIRWSMFVRAALVLLAVLSGFALSSSAFALDADCENGDWNGTYQCATWGGDCIASGKCLITISGPSFLCCASTGHNGYCCQYRCQQQACTPRPGYHQSDCASTTCVFHTYLGQKYSGETCGGNGRWPSYTGP